MTQQTADNLKIIDIRSIRVPNSVKNQYVHIDSLTGQPGMCRQALRLKEGGTDGTAGYTQQIVSGGNHNKGFLATACLRAA